MRQLRVPKFQTSNLGWYWEMGLDCIVSKVTLQHGAVLWNHTLFNEN